MRRRRSSGSPRYQLSATLTDPPPGQAPLGLTGTAADVLTDAADQARELGHHYIRPEHLILGLLAQPQELAAEALAELSVTAEIARERVKERLGTASARPTGSLGAAPQTKQLLELAHAIANSLGTAAPKPSTSSSPRAPRNSTAQPQPCWPIAVQAPTASATSSPRILLHEAPELAERLRNRSLLSRVRMRQL